MQNIPGVVGNFRIIENKQKNYFMQREMSARVTGNNPVFLILGVILIINGCVTHAPEQKYARNNIELFSETAPDRSRELLLYSENFVRKVSNFMRLPEPSHKLRINVFQSFWSLKSYLADHRPRMKYNQAAIYADSNGFVITVSQKWREADTMRSLRHELAHYVMASYFYGAPPWIDEGLAKYFENGELFGDVNAKSLRRLKKSIQSNDKDVLEKLVAVPYGGSLTKDQYAQAWGLVYFIMSDTDLGLSSVLEYLRHVRSESENREYFKESFGAYPGDFEEPWRKFIVALRAKH